MKFWASPSVMGDQIALLSTIAMLSICGVLAGVACMWRGRWPHRQRSDDGQEVSDA